jgi:hypothetical protein
MSRTEDCVEALLGRGVSSIVKMLTFMAKVYDWAGLPYSSDLDLPPPHWDENADDLWPAEAKPQITDTQSEPELVVSPQWGLRLPRGEVAWNTWQGVSFFDPLDRMLMVAKLQQTGLDMGFAQDQLGEFLGRYGWATRNQIATVVYEDTGTYSLIDPEVSASVPTVDVQNDNESENAPTLPDDPHRSVRQGPVGGVAQ